MSYIVNQTFDELKIGNQAKLIHVFTKQDIDLFAAMSGDVNPAHVDAEFAKDDMFHKIIAHGMWGGALISAILGTKLPGPGTIYLSQTLKFLHPIAIGDKITVKVVVVKKHKRNFIVELDCKCINQFNKEVIIGRAKVIAPTTKIKRKKISLQKMTVS